jgi:hypothetical protein
VLTIGSAVYSIGFILEMRPASPKTLKRFRIPA